MKAAIVLLIFIFTVNEVFGGTIYGVKEDAITEINNKYKCVEDLLQKVFKLADDEYNKFDESAENDALNYGKNNKESSKKEFEKDIVVVARTAIAKGKPQSAFDCIAKVSFDGRDLFEDVCKNYEKMIKNVKINKQKKSQNEMFELNIINVALKELKDEAVEKINKTSTDAPVNGLKTDAFKKIDTAQKLAQDIESNIPKPLYANEYLNLKRSNENKNKEIRQTNLKKLQACVN